MRAPDATSAHVSSKDFLFWYAAPFSIRWPKFHAYSIKFGRNRSCAGLDWVPWDNVALLDIAVDDVA